MKSDTAEPKESVAQALTLSSHAELRLKRILVATDFTACSQKALRYAVSMARQYNAEVLLLHVYEQIPPRVGFFEEAPIETAIYENGAKHLEEWRAEVSQQVKVEALLRVGTPPYKQIVSVATDLDADLLIIGNHGRNAMARALMGSTAEKVVRFAPCPVLVIREREHEFLVDQESAPK